jgi:hypothetical protein
MRADGKKFEQNSARRDTMVNREANRRIRVSATLIRRSGTLIRRSAKFTSTIGTIGFTWAVERLSLPPVGSITCAGALGSDA